jgi:hypothetical protein
VESRRSAVFQGVQGTERDYVDTTILFIYYARMKIPERTQKDSFDPTVVFNKVRNQPPPELSATSRELLRSSPIDWAVARKRMLESALVSADEELFETVVHEYAAVVGIDGAISTVLTIWGNMVNETYSSEQTDGPHIV